MQLDEGTKGSGLGHVIEELREGRGLVKSRESNFERRGKEMEIRLGVGGKSVTSTGNFF